MSRCPAVFPPDRRAVPEWDIRAPGGYMPHFIQH